MFVEYEVEDNGKHAQRDFSVPQVIVHVEHVGQETLAGLLLQAELIHLVVHVDRLPCDLLPRPAHPQEPGEPLQKHRFHLKNYFLNEMLWFLSSDFSLGNIHSGEGH